MTGRKLTLDSPAAYEIVVAGLIEENWADWITATIVVSEDEETPLSTLSATLDQAGLHGLLGRLYSLGYPLVSVTCSGGGRE